MIFLKKFFLVECAMGNNGFAAFNALESLGSASRFAEEIHEIIDRIPLFEDFNRSEIEALCAYMTCYAAPRDVPILREGEEGDFLLVVLTGKVAVKKAMPTNETKVITMVGPGASLGEMSLIDGHPRFASCLTVEPTDFAVLTRDELNEILINQPRLGNKLLLVLLQMMAHRLRDASERLLPYISEVAI
ncbi:MAG: cyclic nucleotide-binding domain-containing protein [Rhodocyclaceae bacterium]|nr:cyclic nucleotide-binding domain-containing protein [Rhodocyclaceae bacterium]